MTSEITTKKFLDWNVGEGKRFKNLNELLEELKGLRSITGPFCGFAGGRIDEEIKEVEEMIAKNE